MSLALRFVGLGLIKGFRGWGVPGFRVCCLGLVGVLA